MRKLTLFLALAMLTATAKAVIVPLDERGIALNTIDFVGAIPCAIDFSTGTAAVMCNNWVEAGYSTTTAGAVSFSAGPGIVLGVIVSTLPTTDYITFRDSNTANTTSSVLFGVFNSTSNANTASVGNNLIKFPVPVYFKNGISVNAANAPTSGSGLGKWVILYRPLSR